MKTGFAFMMAALTGVTVACAEDKAAAPAPSPMASAPAAPAAPTIASAAVSAPAVMTAPPPAAASANAANANWSPVVSGVRGRILVTKAVDAKGRPQVRLDLELENVSDSATPVEVWWSNDLGSMLKLTLEDESGTALPIDAVGGSFASGPPHWLALPVSSTIKSNISPGAIEYVPNGHVLLRPFTFQAWAMPAQPTKLYFRGMLTPPAAAADAGAAAHHAWSGHLELPRVALP